MIANSSESLDFQFQLCLGFILKRLINSVIYFY